MQHSNARRTHIRGASTGRRRGRAPAACPWSARDGRQSVPPCTAPGPTAPQPVHRWRAPQAWRPWLGRLLVLLLALGGSLGGTSRAMAEDAPWMGSHDAPVGRVMQVSAGQGHTCGVQSDGTLACWGRNVSGQATPPSGTFGQVSAGFSHTCGVQSNGTLACWGSNSNGRATPPGGPFVQVSAGGFHTCGVQSDGTLACWGLNSDGRATPPSGTFGQVSAGFSHTCGVQSNGTLACWGSNSDGRATPPGGIFVQVSAGDFHTCGVQSDGTLACWGSNSSGQAPQLTLTPATLPAGQVGTAYSPQTLTVSAPPYTPPTPRFTVDAGTLPPGLTLAEQTGLLEGTPTSVGTFAFTVLAEDDNGFTATRAYSLPVTDPTPPSLTPLVSGTLGSNGWYVSTVTVSWTATDPDSPITSQTGCGTTLLSVDTAAAGTTLTCTATSAGGTTTQSVTIRRDATPPTVTCASADGLWHASDVSLACTASDSPAGLAHAAEASFSLTTTVAAGTETATATTGSRSIADLAGHTATAGPLGGNRVDKKAPSITLSVPSATTYALGQVVAASYSCTDGGAGVATCAGPVATGAPINTAAVGPKTFTVQATDAVGNASSASVTYTVVAAPLQQVTALLAAVDRLPVSAALKAVLKAPVLVARGGLAAEPAATRQ